MPSLNNPLQVQTEFLMKIKPFLEDNSCLTDRMLLLSIFKNYRSNGGINLTKFAYDIATEHFLCDFFEFKLDFHDNPAIICMNLDKFCKSPYYFNGKDIIFISDSDVTFGLSMFGDNFLKYFQSDWEI